MQVKKISVCCPVEFGQRVDNFKQQFLEVRILIGKDGQSLVYCLLAYNPIQKAQNVGQLSSVHSQLSNQESQCSILTAVLSRQDAQTAIKQNDAHLQFKVPDKMNYSHLNQLIRNYAFIVFHLPPMGETGKYTQYGYLLNAVAKGKLSTFLGFDDKVGEWAFTANQNNLYRSSKLDLLLQQIKHIRLADDSFYFPQSKKNHSQNIKPLAFFQVQPYGVFEESQSIKKSKAGCKKCYVLVDVRESPTDLAKKVTDCIINHKSMQQGSELGFMESYQPHKLANPHEYLKTEQKQKYVVYFTKGIYEYFHYSDNGLNDEGWGCAYRALQSLLSWFHLQNYINLAKIPSIPQIQALIDYIDTSDKISGTDRWIGCTEVSWVIHKLTGYNSKTIHVANGANIIEYCEVFRQHLETVGSPIVFGGNQYAYSIVGMNYSWQLGECTFCILDPHYNGTDSLDKIIERKGVSWKKPEDLFKKGIFYNFCLPMI